MAESSLFADIVVRLNWVEQWQWPGNGTELMRRWQIMDISRWGYRTWIKRNLKFKIGSYCDCESSGNHIIQKVVLVDAWILSRMLVCIALRNHLYTSSSCWISGCISQNDADGQEEVLNSFSSLQNCPPSRLASTYNDIARTKNLLWLDGSDRLGIIILQHLMSINRVIISSCCAAN